MKLIKFIDMNRGGELVAIRPEEIYTMQEHKYAETVNPELFSKVNGTRDPKTGFITYDYKKETEAGLVERTSTYIRLKNGDDFLTTNMTIADIEKLINE